MKVTSAARSVKKQIDNAIVSFNEGNQLGKFYFGEQDANIYIPQDGKDYAAVNAAETTGEMPLNFKAEKNGTYTLSFDTEAVSFSYLHLIDNLTGADVDLLHPNANPNHEAVIAGEDPQSPAPSYTFEAKTTDYASRFKLVFAQGESANEDNFAFMRDNHLLVLGIEGQATLQVIDLMGRILSSETINGNVSKAVNAPAGVYVLRLINGDEVKTQKIVIK